MQTIAKVRVLEWATWDGALGPVVMTVGAAACIGWWGPARAGSPGQTDQPKPRYLQLRDEGKYSEAILLAEETCASLEEKPADRALDLADCLATLGVLYVDQGMYPKAEPVYERALTIHTAILGPDDPQISMDLSNMAVLYHTQGEYETAERLYEQALAVYDRSSKVEHAHVAVILNCLAVLNHDLGANDKARRLYQRALEEGEIGLGPNDPSLIPTINNLALLSHDQRDLQAAERLYLRALSMGEAALGADHPEIATSLTNLAALYRDMERYEEAERLHRRSIAILEASLGPDHPQTATSLNNLAVVYHEQGQYEKAEGLYERALHIHEAALGSNHPVVALALDNLASLLRDQGLHDLALPFDQRALEIEERNLARTLVVADESRRLSFAATLAPGVRYMLSLHFRATPTNPAVAELALTTLLRRKGRVSDLMGQSFSDLRHRLPEEDQHLLADLAVTHARYAALVDDGRGERTQGEFSEQLDEIEREQDRLWRELAERSPLIQTLNRPVTIKDVQPMLPTDAALVELAYYVPRHDDAGNRVLRYETAPPPRYAAYLVFPTRFDWVDLGPAEPIDRHVAAFRRALQLEQAIPPDLHDAVMSPILERIGDADQLVIAPDGALNLVPFGALHDGERYLVERYDIRYVTTGRDLLERPEHPLATSPVTIVANPTGADLSAAELEADFLSDFFLDTRVLRHDDATETNVRTLERPLVLHMATHGFFGQARHERDNPMLRSGLELADVTQVEVDRELDDGRLTAYEISGWDLRGTQLVVLSACETGMGAIATGEGVLGLRRAFAMAGAETQVMSLWHVGDVTTLEIMKAYYLELAKGKGRGEAMQAVQLAMLRSEDRSHPHDWAAFIVAGDDAPMSFPPGEEPHVPAQAPPAPIEDVRGCATTKSTDRPAPVASLLVAFLGLAALRRRRS